MNKIILLAIITLLGSCSGIKKSQQNLLSGNYDMVIRNTVGKLRKNKNNKNTQEYIRLLEESFDQSDKRDLGSISFMEKENNPENFAKIYETYRKISSRQELVTPLFSSYEALKMSPKIRMVDYSSEIINYANKTAGYVYNQAKSALSTNNSKIAYREAYDKLAYVNTISPNYQNTNSLIEQAHQKGTDFVKVNFKNSSNKILPANLEKDLLNIDTYQLNNFWTVYHTTLQGNLNYDYEMIVDFNNLEVSPEQIREKQFQREKTVVDKVELLRDKNGKIVKDEKGNKIEVEVTKNVTCEYYEFNQFKAATVTGLVSFVNIKNKQVVEKFPLRNELVFEHVYATHKGDNRALEESFLERLAYKYVDFPTNEQMIYDASMNLKADLKRILNKQNFTR